MSSLPLVPDSASAEESGEQQRLRSVNARLREVVEGKDEQLATQDKLMKAQGKLIEELQGQVADLARRLGMDSTNSSTPPSKDPIAAKAKRKGRQGSQRVRSEDRKPGGQPGRQGSGLEPTREPDRTERADPPAQCRGCGTDLGDAADAGAGWAQVWDVPPIAVEKVAYVLPRRRCGCGKVTTAGAPFGQAQTVMYGPNVNAAAIMLASEGNVPVERTAMLLEALLRAPVSTGFVARACERFADALDGVGFDEAMRTALGAEDVLCGDETPVNVARRDVDENGVARPGAPHVVAVRTPDERLVWYTALGARTKTAIAGLGVLTGYTGYLVRDDYAGWHQFDADLAGVQQCTAHLIRHLQGVWDLHPDHQGWAGNVQEVLREANTAVQAAKADGADRLDPVLLGELRARYDKAVHWGQITNRHRDWPRGNHPGYTLARRLAAKADQVWLFTTVFAVPWTNNASEQALKSPKLHQKVSGYWHTLTTLARFCRIRSYLVSARNHGLRSIDAIHAALTGKPWLPNPAAA